MATATVSASRGVNPVTDNQDKFSLFLKTREIKQLTKALEKIMVLPAHERRKWFREHGELIQTSFDNMIDDSNNLFEDIRLDDEMMELSQDLIVSLREAVYLLEHLTQDSQQLKG